MIRKGIIGAGVIMLTLGSALPAGAQDMSESVLINAGTAQQARAQATLSSAINKSFQAASNAIAMAPSSNGTSGSYAGRSARPMYLTYAIPANVDPLAGTDAPTYRLASGTTLRVSRGLDASASAVCIANCADGD